MDFRQSSHTAIVETPVAEQTKLTSSNAAKAAPPKNGQLPIGTLIKIGDTWKTFDLPKNLSGEQTAVALAFGAGVSVLTIAGVRYSRLEKLDGAARVFLIAVNVGLGLLIVLLKATVAH